jgi:hypothetical protein
LLENVIGFMRVLDQILEVLEKNLPEYFSLHQTKRRRDEKGIPMVPIAKQPGIKV